MKIPTANLSQMKNFMVSWREVEGYWSGYRHYEYLAVRLSHRITAGKAVSVAGSVLERKGKHVEDSLRASICDFGYWEDDYVLQSKHIKAIAATVPLIGRGLVR